MYQNSNFISRYFYTYVNKTIRDVTANKFAFKDEMVVNMNREKVEKGQDESFIEIERF